MSSFTRNAALWVLRQAARRLAEETAKRRQSGAGAGSAYRPAPGTGQPFRPAQEPPTSTAGTGSTHRPADERPAWSYSAGPRADGLPQRVEDLARRAWPYLDTPANRERVARFVERMRTAPNRPR